MNIPYLRKFVSKNTSRIKARWIIRHEKPGSSRDWRVKQRIQSEFGEDKGSLNQSMEWERMTQWQEKSEIIADLHAQWIIYSGTTQNPPIWETANSNIKSGPKSLIKFIEFNKMQFFFFYFYTIIIFQLHNCRVG